MDIPQNAIDIPQNVIDKLKKEKGLIRCWNFEGKTIKTRWISMEMRQNFTDELQIYLDTLLSFPKKRQLRLLPKITRKKIREKVTEFYGVQRDVFCAVN